MNYYILPKNKINLRFKLNSNAIENDDKPFISNSIITHLSHIFSQVDKVCTNINVDEIINPLEFVHSAVPGTQLSVSKVKSDSNILFELMELFQLCTIFEENTKLNIVNVSENIDSISNLINMLRDENDDNIFSLNFNYNLLNNMLTDDLFKNNQDLLIFEFNKNDYTTNKYNLNLIFTLKLILYLQKSGGNCIIKLDNITNKVVIEVLYILSGLYDKVYLLKPNICSITSSHRYLICKQYTYDSNYYNSLKDNFENIIINQLFINNNAINNYYVSSIIENNVPNYFLSKLEELNAIIAQQQLESLDQTINILRNKNKDDKLDILKRNHIQKCIQWCEKNQLPHNKFIDKTNIFLNEKRKEENCTKTLSLPNITIEKETEINTLEIN